MIDSKFIWLGTTNFEVDKADWDTICNTYVKAVIDKQYIKPSITGKVVVTGTFGTLTYWAQEELIQLMLDSCPNIRDSLDQLDISPSDTNFFILSVYDAVRSDRVVKSKLKGHAIKIATAERDEAKRVKEEVKSHIRLWYDENFNLPVQFISTNNPVELYYVVGVCLLYIPDVHQYFANPGVEQQIGTIED